MMIKSKFLIGIFLIVFLVSNACKSPQASLSVINLKDARGIRHYSTLYSLPKTVIRVNLEVVKTTFKKGPYYNYAESYLGLTDVIKQDKEHWKITSIEFETYAIADTNQVYLIETNDEQSKVELKLTDWGLLESVYPKSLNLASKNNVDEYKSLPVTKQALLKSHKLTDSRPISFDDVPLPKSLLAKRSTREQAIDLSSKILTLRDDRAAILVGDGYTETMPSGEALKIMIDKIDAIQKKYLAMFKGKTKKQTFRYSFDYIPDEPRKITQSILFRFSEEYGIVDNTNMDGKPMIIEVESYENLKNYEDFKTNQVYLKRAAKEKDNKKGLFYRIPEMGIVRLLAKEDVLMQEKIQLSQFGAIHSLPAKYLNGEYAIELYPELGALKGITKIKKQKTEKEK